MGRRTGGRIYTDHRDLTKELRHAAMQIPNQTPLRGQVQVLLVLEDMFNEEKSAKGKLAWLIAISSELAKLSKMEPEDEFEEQIKADMIGMYNETQTWNRAQESIRGLDEQVRGLKVKLKEDSK